MQTVGHAHMCANVNGVNWPLQLSVLPPLPRFFNELSAACNVMRTLNTHDACAMLQSVGDTSLAPGVHKINYAWPDMALGV